MPPWQAKDWTVARQRVAILRLRLRLECRGRSPEPAVWTLSSPATSEDQVDQQSLPYNAVMIDTNTQKRLQELFRRENRSFLQYVNEATPWAGNGDRPLVEKVSQLAAEELESLEALAEWMDSKRISLPYLGAFPTTFTNYNFVAIRKLMKPLVTEQSKELADLEADAQALTDPEAKRMVENLVALNRKHLRDFEQMNAVSNGKI
jgi:tRNA isopentenyl-2-thiomethyl-A-37 hydroxylase MiaE